MEPPGRRKQRNFSSSLGEGLKGRVLATSHLHGFVQILQGLLTPAAWGGGGTLLVREPTAEGQGNYLLPRLQGLWRQDRNVRGDCYRIS